MNNYSIIPSKSFEDKSKRCIVVDGQNVGIRHGGNLLSSKALKIVIEFWIRKGHPIQVLLLDFYFNKEEVAKRKKMIVNELS